METQKPFNVDEAANFLGISKSHLYKLTSSGSISHYKPGGKCLYFMPDDLLDYIKSGKVKTADELETDAIEMITA